MSIANLLTPNDLTLYAETINTDIVVQTKVPFIACENIEQTIHSGTFFNSVNFAVLITASGGFPLPTTGSGGPNSVFTPPIPGWYLICYSITWRAQAGGFRDSRIIQNGVEVFAQATQLPSSSIDCQTGSMMIFFNGTSDSFAIDVHQDSGADIGLITTGSSVQCNYLHS